MSGPAAAAPIPVTLPWPPEVLPRVPPLAPETTGVFPLPLRFVRQISNRERVVVDLRPSGKPDRVRVLQTIVVKRLGDYVFTIPAPVESVRPGPRTESQPGKRENQILWEGFSPGRRVLSAWADLRVAESVAGLPLEVHAEPHVVTIRNTTAVTVPSFSADTEPASLAQVSERVRAAIKANVFPEGLSVVVRGKKTPEQVRVAAPLLVRGALVLDRMRVPFSARLDGLRRSELRLEVDRPYELELKARPADIEPPPAARNARELLEQTIWLELTYARKRQFDQFLASPDQTGPSSATYVYRTAADPLPAAEVTPQPEDEDHATGWIVLGLALAAALPAAAVLWARS